MKKIMIYLSIFLFARQASASSYYLNPVKIDSMVSVSMPQSFTKTDTLKQQILSANGAFGAMMAIKTDNPPNAYSVKNQNGLKDVFDEYVNKVEASMKGGKIINAHDTVVNKLRAHDFTLQVDTGAGTQLRQFRLIYTKNANYTFEYLYDEFRTDVAKGEMKAFFESIKLAPQLILANQRLVNNPANGNSIVKVIVFAGGGALLAAVIFWVVWRRRNSLSHPA